MFRGAGTAAIHKEMQKLYNHHTYIPVDPNNISRGDKCNALKYMMFLKKKRGGSIKGCGCSNGRSQRLYTSKHKSSLPTVAIKSLILSCVIDTKEGRKLATVDIPGAFMKCDMEKLVHVKFEGVMA